MTATLAPEVPYPRAMERFPTLRQSLLGAFDLCALEARLGQEFEYLDSLDEVLADDEPRMQWHTHPQARGTIFHRWAARLLDLLAVLDQDGLADEVECKVEQRKDGSIKSGCGLRPNELEPDEPDGDVATVHGRAIPIEPYGEAKPCPMCGKPLERVPLTEEALDLLVDTLRQDEVTVENVVRVPQREAKDLEWIVCKFAREQRFAIGNFVGSEERLEAELEYPNPHGGVVRRKLTGQLDALFWEQMDGGLHAYVLDWKDTWAIPAATTISREGYWQQRFYAWLVMRNQPEVQRVTLEEVYVRYSGGEDGEDNHRKATITRDKLPLIERQLAVVAEAFDRAWEAFEDLRAFQGEHGEEELAENPMLQKRERILERRVRALFAPTPGGHCNWCPLPHKCPIVDDVRVHGTARTFEDAKRIAGELAVIARAKKHRETALRGWLDEHRTAAVDKPVKDDGEKLRVYTDRPAGLPDGVPLQQAKGKKSYALVEGKRQSKPDREQVEELLEDAAKGRKIKLDDYYRSTTSVSMRLVEERVPTDEAAALTPEVEEALARSLERLERIRAA
jgi:hypothetical protein